MLKFVAICCGSMLAFGFLGPVHAAADSFAVLRVPLAIGLAVFGCLSVRKFWSKLAVLAVSLAPLVPIVVNSLFGLTSLGQDFVLYQQNLSSTEINTDGLLNDIAMSGAEMITLQEVSRHSIPIVERLSAQFPTKASCNLHSTQDVMVLSKFDMIPGSYICAASDGMVAVQLDTPHGPVRLASLHLRWPWPLNQSEQVERLMPFFQRLEGHVVIAGDFNAVGWSYSIKSIARASGTALIGPYKGTFSLFGIPLGIDHVLTSSAGPQRVQVAGPQRVQVGSKNGSDHYGVIAFLSRPIAP